MSAGDKPWDMRGTGDTCNIVISIPGQARTDPPDKRRSLAEEATVEDGQVGTPSALQTEHVCTPESSFGDTQQQQQHRSRRYQQNQISPEKQLSHHQVWIPNQFSQQQISVGSVLTLEGGSDSTDLPIDVFSSCEFCNENSERFDWAKNSETCEEDSSVQNSLDTSAAHASITASVSPRLSKYRRQNRVLSSDEPPNYAENSENETAGRSRRQEEDGCTFPVFVKDDCHQISGNKSETQPKTPTASQTNGKQTCSNADAAEISHSVVGFQNHSSSEKGSSLAPVANENTSLIKSWSNRRRKKEEKENEDRRKKDDSLNHKSKLAVDGSQTNLNGIDEDSSRLRSTTSSSKGSRRLVKRGIGMFPSSNWRRLRNTLKAANEMQSSRKQRHALTREDSFLRKFSTRNHQNIQQASSSVDDDAWRSCYSSSKFGGRFVIQHDGNFMFYWLGVVTVSVLYNLWTCIVREAFREIQQGCPSCWYSFDALFDLIYICDIMVQFRTGYLDQGLMVYDSKKLRQKYAKSKVIYIDFICLLPLDFVQLAIGVHPMLRFPRFLKVYRPFRFLHMLESRTAYPNLIRVANLTHILFLGAHWFAAFYYMISEAEGFKGEWAYPKPVGEFSDVNRKYLRSLFWSTLTLTTIGDIPPPGNSNDLRMSNAAYVFVIVSYLIGVFVFATIVGQVGNVINNRNASRQEFERLLDGAKIYMQTHNVPHNLQKRVQRWYDYVWSRGRLNGCDINSLGLLPDKLKTELAIHVNLETLKKVTIFQECQPEFLHDLVLKMKAYIFTPGDLICRRGEVAREMFIIADGVVEIISETGVILKRMGAGDFFGEIGILNLDGGINRRTADVRSVGYLELFVLSREDVLAALKDHPEAESIIRDYGQRRLREVEAHRQKVKPLKCKGSIDQPGNPTGTPQTVQNRFLQTLRSLNPSARRQSAQVNHLGSPPAVGQTASPTDIQRCVSQRGSPLNKANSSFQKASSINTQSGLAIVSLDRTDFSPGESKTMRRSDNYPGRRQSLGYFRTAYARFRNVFQRRRAQRRSVDFSDARRRELWEDRLLFKSADDQLGPVDFIPHSSAFKPVCNVTLNVEDCSEGKKTECDDEAQDNDDAADDCTSSREEKTGLSSGVKRGSLLFPGLSEIEARKYGHNLGRIIQRKYSEPVSYISVCTEDLDEKYSHRGLDDDDNDDSKKEQPQIILDVGKISKILEGEGLSKKEGESNVSDAFCTYSEHFNPACSTTNVQSNSTLILTKTKTSFISNANPGCCKDDDDRNKVNDNSSKGNLVNGYNSEDVSSRVTDSCEDYQSSDPRTEACNLAGNSEESSNSGKRSETEVGICETPDRCSPLMIQRKSVSTAVDNSGSPSRQGPDRSPSIRSQGRTSTQTSTGSESSRQHSGCVFHISGDSNFPSTSLLTASPSPFTLSCHCDPADNYKKFIGCHLAESIHHTLVKASDVPDAGFLNSVNSRFRHESKARTSSDGDAPQHSSTLSPCVCSQSGRSLSFPTLTESLPAPRESGLCLPRRPSCQVPEHFLFDEAHVNGSPKLTKLKQDEETAKRNESRSMGRSHAMSIIQQPTSDLSYQQLMSQMNVMQGMIDRRLTHLEEAYNATTAKLECLTASQDLLVQLLKQQMDKECAQLYPNDEDVPPKASLV